MGVGFQLEIEFLKETSTKLIRNINNNNNNKKMRFSICLLLALVLCASFTYAQNSNQTYQKKSPVSLKGPNAIPVKCSLTKNECGCWSCSAGYLTSCVYDFSKSGC
ncbi:transmembrane protein, putative (macronuclear) [Tetrahymena thermophila SB210]|uniref:Transmembrane protein, putative n=1 Tax=Tetrahymena thermophila (strain SB210) TaxID=312017 RepID=I7LUL9_TETTS|nr:transmembrane protein, putative [Tetrahymena thermophila SB210]EAR94927.2 transmembrane protein, putative [Tetrahymena thermophila SB210]|eukprot:XP_001015172.2 transmembrane protein, putative [Tetrahymena thermophila SB210]